MEKENKNEVVTTKKERMNIFVFSFLMLLAFVFTFFMVHGFISNFIYNNINDNMFSIDIIFEAILAVLAFIVMLFWKNSYVFSQKKEKFISSLRYGWFYLIFGGMIGLIFFVASLNNIAGIINVGLFCFLIGIYEEFLCRGWLLNEFLERYGDTKKGVWTSIIASGVIFGLIHFINISSGGLANTFVQVFSASATGIIFGLIYYKTKNIWTVVFLHGFWDFCLFLMDLMPLTEVSLNSGNITGLSVVFAILIAASELIMLIPFIKDVDAKVENSKIFKYSMLAGATFLVVMFANGFVNMEEVETQEIHNLAIKEYSITTDNYETYDINHTEETMQVPFDNEDSEDLYVPEIETIKYSFSLYKTYTLLTLKNNTTNESVNIEYNDLYDYAIYEMKDYYIIALVNADPNGNYELKYTKLNKEELSNDEEYLTNANDSMKSLLLGEPGEICKLYDKENNLEYVAVKGTDYGYFVLLEDDKIALLNRDKEE